MKVTPFWSDEFPRPGTLPSDPLPSTVDVAVIGSGYTGLHAAIALADAGLSTAVLDSHTVGWGASSRNGGMLITGLKEEMPAVAKRYGLERARALWAWSLASIDYVEQFVADEAIACEFHRTGHCYLAYKPSHFAGFPETIKWYRTYLDYHDLQLVEPAELAAEIGSRAYHGALTDSRTAGLHPAKYVFGLALAAARRGVQLVEQCTVTALTREDGSFRLHTPRGELQAGKVLIATNGYTEMPAPIRNGLFPVGSYLIATEPLPIDLQRELSPRQRMFFDSKNFLNYFRLTSDGRMLFGGRHNLSPNLDVQESARMLQRRMVEVFPALAAAPLAYSWMGRLGLTFDLLPHAGRLTDGPYRDLYYAYGYAGHGVAIASYLGREMGAVMAGLQPPSLVSQLRQQRYCFTKYDRVYLPVVSTWFRFLDRIR